MASMGTTDDDAPRLLSGGNPQIPKGEGDGVVQDYIAAMPGWKQGVGRRLTEGLMQYLSNLGAAYATLEVRKSNEVAQNLYKSLGFIKLGVRKRYYEDNGEDALIMVCDHMPEVDPDFEEEGTIHE